MPIYDVSLVGIAVESVRPKDGIQIGEAYLLRVPPDRRFSLLPPRHSTAPRLPWPPPFAAPILVRYHINYKKVRLEKIARYTECVDGITLTEMAAQLSLKSTTPLRRLCEAGKPRAIKKGKTWLVDPAEVAVYRTQRIGNRGRPPKPKVSTHE